MSLEAQRHAFQKTLDAAIKQRISTLKSHNTSLIKAMGYMSLAPGKRLRAFLTHCIGEMMDVPPLQTLNLAMAIELIHTYSLIHDDLPAMDNATLRRGQPTCHHQYDEATAILTGDALIPYAFEILSEETTHPSPQVRCELISKLAKAIGPQGMVMGQMLDLLSSQKPFSEEDLTTLQHLKTGALFQFSCIAPAILAQHPQTTQRALEKYATSLGLAFQMVDDLLDHTSHSTQTGKTTQLDAKNKRLNFITLLGVEATKRKAEKLIEEAIKTVQKIPFNTTTIESIGTYVLSRSA